MAKNAPVRKVPSSSPQALPTRRVRAEAAVRYVAQLASFPSPKEKADWIERHLEAIRFDLDDWVSGLKFRATEWTVWAQAPDESLFDVTSRAGQDMAAISTKLRTPIEGLLWDDLALQGFATLLYPE